MAMFSQHLIPAETSLFNSHLKCQEGFLNSSEEILKKIENMIDFSHNTNTYILIIFPCKNIFVRLLSLTGLLDLAGRFKEALKK